MRLCANGLLAVLTASCGLAGAEAVIEWVSQPVRAPNLHHRVFASKAAKAKVSYHIYIPEAYDTESTRRFPTLYWLHGGGGDRTGGHLKSGGGAGPAVLSRYFGDAIRQGKVPPMLVVFPNGLRSGMWCDSKDGKTPVETIVIKELIPDVDANFRTVPSRQGRVIEGFSMGGYGAARLGFKYHRVFGAVSLLGAGPLQQVFAPQIGPRGNAGARARLLKSVYGGDQEYFRAQSPWFLAEQNAAPLRGGVRVRQLVGERDFTLPANRDFDAHLTRLGIPHSFEVVPGIEHNPQALLEALGEENWKFYRDVFRAPAGRAPEP